MSTEEGQAAQVSDEEYEEEEVVEDDEEEVVEEEEVVGTFMCFAPICLKAVNRYFG